MYDLAAGVTKMSFGELMQGNTTDVSCPLKLKLDFHALFPSLTMKTGRACSYTKSFRRKNQSANYGAAQTENI